MRDWSFYNEPWWYQEIAPGLRINRCQQDFRSQSALLCVLQHEPDPNTYILVVDDDVVYHPFLVERLLNESLRAPGAMIGSLSYDPAFEWCRRHNEHGTCVRPNLLHTTFGLLFQRRFFDASIFNFAAAAHALQRVRPEQQMLFDYVVTSCQWEDNLWYEAHLARKGIPRVALNSYLGAKAIGDLFYEKGALTSSAASMMSSTDHSFNRDDPHTSEEALEVCTRAVDALWGPSLWATRPRRVAAVTLPRGSGVEAIAAVLSGFGWWSYDVAVFFTCSENSLPALRNLLNAHGALRGRLHYLHSFRSNHGDLPPFMSEVFDTSAFSPEVLTTDSSDSESDLGFYAGLRPSAAVPGWEGAGSMLPLADIVELCPARAEREGNVNAQSPPS